MAWGHSPSGWESDRGRAWLAEAASHMAPTVKKQRGMFLLGSLHPFHADQGCFFCNCWPLRPQRPPNLMGYSQSPQLPSGFESQWIWRRENLPVGSPECALSMDHPGHLFTFQKARRTQAKFNPWNLLSFKVSHPKEPLCVPLPFPTGIILHGTAAQ